MFGTLRRLASLIKAAMRRDSQESETERSRYQGPPVPIRLRTMSFGPRIRWNHPNGGRKQRTQGKRDRSLKMRSNRRKAARAAKYASVVLAFALPFAFTPSVRAQTVTVSASNLYDGSSPANGTITFAPVLSNGQAASYRYPGGGQRTVGVYSATVTNGAFTITLPDTSQTSPVNLCFNVVLTGTRNRLGAGYSCVQPAASNSWCTAGVCNFDNYTPNESPLVLSQAGPTGPQGPAGAGFIAGLASDGHSGISVTGAVSAPNLPISLLASGGNCNGTFDNTPILNAITLANKGKNVRIGLPDGEPCGIGSTVNLYGGQSLKGAPGGGVQTVAKLVALSGFVGTDMVQLQQAPNNLGQTGYFADGEIDLELDQGSNTGLYAVQAASGIDVTNSTFDVVCATVSYCLHLDQYSQGNRIRVQTFGGANEESLYLNGNDNLINLVDREQGAAGSNADPYVYITGNENKVNTVIVEGTCSSNKTGFSIVNANDLSIEGYHDECNAGSTPLAISGSSNVRIGNIDSTLSGVWLSLVTSPSVWLDSLTDMNNGAPQDFSSYVSLDATSHLTIGTFSTQSGGAAQHLDSLPNVTVDRHTVLSSFSADGVQPFVNAAAPGGGNLLTNSDFGAGIWNWSCNHASAQTAVTGPFGETALQFDYTGDSGTFNEYCYQAVTITPSMVKHPLTISLYALSSQGAGPNVCPIAFGGAGVTYSFNNCGATTLGKWDLLQMTIVPTATGTVNIGWEDNVTAGPGGTITDITDVSLSPGQTSALFSGRLASLRLTGQTQVYASAAPTTGTWKQGDLVWNTAPTAGGTAGWMCVTAGSPGTWKAIALGN